MKYLSAVALSVLLSVSAVFGFSTWHQNKVNQSMQVLKASTYAITGEFGQCSGVLIAPKRLLTAAHCQVGSVLTVAGKVAKIIKTDDVKDLMLLEIDLSCPCVPVGKTNPAVGDELTVVGYPYGSNTGFILVTTSGYVQGYIQAQEFNGYMFTTTPVAPGNSGGGVYQFVSGKWYVVAIVSRGAGHIGVFPTTQMIVEFLKGI
jgi:S1-C subfamily serine protease